MTDKQTATATTDTVPAYRLRATQAVLAYREAELLRLKGPCSTCRLHYAHSGPCDIRDELTTAEQEDA